MTAVMPVEYSVTEKCCGSRRLRAAYFQHLFQARHMMLFSQTAVSLSLHLWCLFKRSATGGHNHLILLLVQRSRAKASIAQHSIHNMRLVRGVRNRSTRHMYSSFSFNLARYILQNALTYDTLMRLNRLKYHLLVTPPSGLGMILSRLFIRQAPKLDMLASVVDRLPIPEGGEFAEPEKRRQVRGDGFQEALEKLADGRKAGGVDDHVCFGGVPH